MSILALDFGSNIFGKLKPEIKARLKAVIDDPCQETWDNSYSIILNANGKMITLWQAVCKVDWMFPQSKPSDSEWSKIPSRETIIEAINLAVFKGNSKQELNWYEDN